VPVYIVLSFSSALYNRCHILDRILKLSGKKYSLALHLVEMDPDPPKLCRLRIHNTADKADLILFTICSMFRVIKGCPYCTVDTSITREKRVLMLSKFYNLLHDSKNSSVGLMKRLSITFLSINEYISRAISTNKQRMTPLQTR
jgi:hypothetical protein